MKYLIIGGVAGGATTAARLRRLDEQAEIIMFERGAYISYANCGLPYYIGGTISERENLFVQTPETFGKRFNMEVRTQNEAISINRENKTILVKDLVKGEEYTESYDKLILSPGAEPVKPPLPGINSKGIYTLRNVPDTDVIKAYIEKHDVKHATVVGAGFIGLEMAENLHDLGIRVTIVEMAEQVMTPLDYSMATLVHQHLKTQNVEFYLNTAVSSFSQKEGERLKVHLNTTRTIETDLVILSIGVRPESQLAKDAALEIGEKKGIVVNKYLQTSDPDIYAVGDAIEFENPIIGKKMITYLAGPANKQGRIVANNLVLGNKHEYKGAINTAIAKVFQLTVAATGVSGKLCDDNNIAHIDSITHSSSHAGYYPGAKPMSIKISFDPDNGRLLGAQIVGYKGVDKRIDLFAEAVRNQYTVFDLAEIEHAYAPPFSSAKDPVNIAGMVAENILNGTTKTIWWRELVKGKPEDYFIIDVRTEDEAELGGIENAVNIPLDNIRERINEIPKNKKLVLYCGVGLRAHVGCRILMQQGFDDVYNLSGGYKTYEHAIQKQSNEDIFANNYIGKDDHIYRKTNEPEVKVSDVKISIEADACGLQCPGPILKLKKTIDSVQDGEAIKIMASDPGFFNDVKSWSKMTGNQLVDIAQEGSKITAIIQKGNKTAIANKPKLANKKSLICFSDDLDKALATFIIANGALAAGHEVNIFFTFWGLNVIKKNNAPKVKKDFVSKMFGKMMPSSANNLKLSKMHMGGIGTSMMRGIMKKKNIDSLESLIQSAIDAGAKFTACQMSMDVMGVQKEELLDSVEIGGVAMYLEQAEESNLNLMM
jgi:NADPH-dependent 2,4-dienoyl-CoA reductase/sulfur reductase-like enzyme/peroxiredoxin family protein/rhodanese-related sulfurtransferase/TusA-related sulfurtransferase